jgi:hypothetical protein
MIFLGGLLLISGALLLGILLLSIGAVLYLLNLAEAAQICVLIGLVLLITGGILSKRNFHSK